MTGPARLALVVAGVLAATALPWLPAAAQLTPPAAIAVTVTCLPQALAYSVAVRGSGFDPFTAALVVFDAAAGGQPETFDATTDGFGTFATAFQPRLRPAGTYLVRADDLRQREATAAAVVSCAVPPERFHPALRFSPAVTRGGFVVSLAGTGFPPDAAVLLDWGALLGRSTVATVTADHSGGLSVPRVLVFRETQLGIVRVVAAPGGPAAFDAADASLLVVPGTVEPPGLRERR
jgi:hypothetical protein